MTTSELPVGRREQPSFQAWVSVPRTAATIQIRQGRGLEPGMPIYRAYEVIDGIEWPLYLGAYSAEALMQRLHEIEPDVQFTVLPSILRD